MLNGASKRAKKHDVTSHAIITVISKMSKIITGNLYSWDFRGLNSLACSCCMLINHSGPQ